MVYNLTEKLNFGEDPVLVIRDKKLTVKTDAEIVLQLLDVFADEQNELSGVRKAAGLLFSEADQKKLRDMKLKTADYLTVVRTAVKLAVGADPDEEQPGE